MAGYGYPRSIEQMRHEVAKAYNGKKWVDKVEAMSESQVYAVYHSLVSEGKIKEKKFDPYKNFKVITG